MAFDDLVPAAALVRGNRMSALPVSEFCPQAGRLGAKYGSGRAAAMSSVFHAQCAGLPEPCVLTLEEAAVVATWKHPDTLEVPGAGTDEPVILRYADAEKEVEVYLDSRGQGTTERQASSVGHLDFAWVVEIGTSSLHPLRIAYVADIKKTAWTSEVDSLQLVAYGHAYAAAVKADGYCIGLYIADTGSWSWDPVVVFCENDPVHEQRRIRLAWAINNTEGQACTGPHCRDCYERLHCPEHLLPAAMADTRLAALTEDSKLELTTETAGELKLYIQAIEDLAGVANDHLKEWVRRNGPIRANGKRVGLNNMPGKETVDKELMRKELGEKAERYIKRGSGYQSWGRWGKEK